MNFIKSNGAKAMVEKARMIVESLDGELASPKEARAILGLKG